MKYLLGLDNGGTGVRCAVFDENGTEIQSASFDIDMEVSGKGKTERDAETLYAANCQAIKAVLDASGISPRDIEAVGITGYGNGLTFVDENALPVYPCIVSTDTRAINYVTEWQRNGIADAVYKSTRQSLFASQAPPLIAWFRDNEPDVLKKAKHALQVKDYIRARLTETICLEYTDMSNSALINIDDHSYAEEVFDYTNIGKYRKLFPDNILRSYELAGVITKKAANLTGLVAGTPVCAGMFDIDACCLSAGILDRSKLCIIGGTWMINEYLSENINEGIGKMATTLSFLDNQVLISESSATGVLNFNWYLKQFGESLFPGKTGKDLYEACSSAVSRLPLSVDTPVFVPYLFSSATRAGSHGAFINLKGSDTPITMLRAIYEGIAFSSAHHVSLLSNGREPFECARFIGGAANSDFWCQMFADVLGIRVEAIKSKNPGAMGAAMCAGMCCGMYNNYQKTAESISGCPKNTYVPVYEANHVYKEKLSLYRRTVSAVDSIS